MNLNCIKNQNSNELKQNSNKLKQDSNELKQNGYELKQKQNKFFPLVTNRNGPSISLNELQNYLKRKKQFQHIISSCYVQQKQQKSRCQDIKQFKVCSPFYNKLSTHKQSCKCPYHKKQYPNIIKHKYQSFYEMNKMKYQHRNIKQNNQMIQNQNEKIQNIKQNNEKIQNQNEKIQSQNEKIQNIDKKIQNKNKFQRIKYKFVNEKIKINQNFKQKINTKNQDYIKFLNQCENFILHKKNNQIIIQKHKIKTSIKKIFQFIKLHLHYSKEQIKKWINSIEKDKEYKQFYLERFVEMKNNHQLNIKNNNTKSSMMNNINMYYSSTGFNKSNALKKSYSNLNTNSFHKSSNQYFGQLRKKKNNSILNNPLQFVKKSIKKLVDKNKTPQDLFDQNIQTIFDKIKGSIKLDSSQIQNLINSSVYNFKKVFKRINDSFLNNQFENQQSQKFKTQFLEEVGSKLQKIINNVNKKDLRTSQLNQKNHIYKQTMTLFSQRSNDINTITSKRRSSIYINKFNQLKNSRGSAFIPQNDIKTFFSKKHGKGDNSRQVSRKNLNQKKHNRNKYNKGSQVQYEKQQEEEEEEEERNEDKMKKRHRKGLMKDSIDRNESSQSGGSFQSILSIQQDYNEKIKEKLKQLQKNIKQDQGEQNCVYVNQNLSKKFTDKAKRGILIKTEDFLIERNLQQLIVKNDDRLLTIKRKLRTLKMLMEIDKQKSTSAKLINDLKSINDLNFVKDYIDIMQDRCQKKLKIQIDTNNIRKEKQTIQVAQTNNIDYNFDYLANENLKFYKLFQLNPNNHDDFFIMLHQVKVKRLQNIHNQQKRSDNNNNSDEEDKKFERNAENDDQMILIQQNMNYQQISNKICHQLFEDQTCQSITVTKCNQSSKIFPKMTICKQTQKNQAIKNKLKYTKINLSQTFNTYLKSTSLYQKIQQH